VPRVHALRAAFPPGGPASRRPVQHPPHSLQPLPQGLLPDQLHPPLLCQLDAVAGGLYASGKDARHLASLSAFLVNLFYVSYVTFCLIILDGLFQGLLPDQLLSPVLPQLDAVACGLYATGKGAKRFACLSAF
jgi:hypothetical protein